MAPVLLLLSVNIDDEAKMKLFKNQERSLNWLKYTPIVVLLLTFTIVALMTQNGFKFEF